MSEDAGRDGKGKFAKGNSIAKHAVRNEVGKFVSLKKHEPPALPIKPIGAPRGFEPGVAWDGNVGELSTGPVTSQPASWDDLLEMWGLDPAEVEIVEPVQRRSWDAAVGGGLVQRLSYFKAGIRRKRAGGPDLDGLIEEIRCHSLKPKWTSPDEEPVAFMLLSGDLQAGKGDGDGTEGMVRRFLAGIESGVARLGELQKTRPVGPIYLPWLGDCIEAVRGHYAQQTFTVQLSLTEQVRLIRRMMLRQIKAFAPLASRIVVPVTGGNHDESTRSDAGKSMTNLSDNWALDIGASVADILAENPDAYGHVSIVLPRPERLDITLDVEGTVVAFAHGHQFASGRDGWQKWWAGQSLGNQPAGEAQILVAGHLHHLRVDQPGPRTFIQIPALDGGSDWWLAKNGQDAPPGIVSMLVGKHAGPSGWSDLAIL